MRIVWDEPKRLANLRKHELDFADLAFFDWSGAAIEPARNDRFGRARFKAVGRFLQDHAVVIFATLGTEAVSIISFRIAAPKERGRLDDQDG